MKNTTISIVIILILSIFTTSCRKVSHNGDLDGQWQMQTIETTDGNVKAAKGVYYNFMLHTAQMQSSNSGTRTANLVYDKGKSILMHFPMNEATQFLGFGLTPDDFTAAPDNEKGVILQLTIRTINSKTLVLVTPTSTILTFRKF